MTMQSAIEAPDAVARVAPAVTQLAVETPSWGYGNSGTRFKVFPQPGVPRNPFEKVEDAAIVARTTGVARSIALHIPWDAVIRSVMNLQEAMAKALLVDLPALREAQVAGDAAGW